MPPPAEPLLQDDSSGEAWYQKGVTLLEGRKQVREIEEKLRKAMARSVLQEWQAWLGLFMGLLTICQAHLGSIPSIVGLTALSSVVMLISAIDSANAKRTQAILDWIEHQRTKEQAKSRIDSAA